MTTESNTSNLMGMARTALLASNNEEALGYFNRVLEVEPENSEAWVGKGQAAAWQSTMMNFRTPEAAIAFNHAISTAAGDQKAAVTAQVVEKMNEIATALYGMARRHLDEFVALDGTWVQYLNQVSQILDALDQARTWDPSNRVTLENIIHLCKDNIEGISYRNFDNSPGAWHLSPDYEKMIKGRLDAAVSNLRALDPTYEPPAIEKKQAEACFVVTATMGNADHPTVAFMRRFRDEWLSQFPAGRRMIRTYYRFGPSMAAFVATSEVRRAISRRVIVDPAERVARFLMKTSR